MYTSFYNLDKKPFEKNPDSFFLWLSEKHKEASSTLLYGIHENKGLMLLTGAAGTGKTILVKAFVKSLDKDVDWAVVGDPIMERVDFYNAIARGFNIDKQFTSKVQFLLQFSHFLHTANDENKKILLLIDDCHLLSQEMLEDLRLLSNIEKADVKLINIFFVGQPEFNEMLFQPKNRALQQRLTLRSELDSLDVGETYNYIRHRLKVAGTKEKLFSAKAVQVIHRFSSGIPGGINAICGNALVSGSAKAIKIIDNKVIEACVQQMGFPGILHQESGDTFPGEKAISKPAEKKPFSSDVILENDNQYGWLKYGLGVFVLLIAGGYFWFRAPQYLDSGQEISTEIADVVVVNTVSPVSSSPAVTILEQYSSVIDEKKAKLKSVIPENPDRRKGSKEEDKDLPAEEVLVEEVVPAVGVQLQMGVDVAKIETSAGPEVSSQQVDLKPDLGQEKQLPPENSGGVASVLQVEVPERATEVPKIAIVEPFLVSPISFSPIFAMLGPNGSVIDEKKPVELKNVIPEKANSRNELNEEDEKEEDKDLPAEEVLAEEAAPAVGVQQQVGVDVVKVEITAEPEVSYQQVDLQQDQRQEKQLLSENSAGDVSVLQIEVPERAIEVPARTIVEPPLERVVKPVVAPLAPLATLAPLEPKKIILGLRPNSLKMTDMAQEELSSFVEKLKLHPQATVTVKGFVSAKSNSPENIKLSEDRALSVQKFMLDKGIEVERMEVVGMGNQEPIATNNTSEGRRKNRRVEVIVIGDGN